MSTKIKMEIRAHISAEMVREILRYDPITGEFEWRDSPLRRRRTFRSPLCLDKAKKRLTIKVFGIRVPATHVAWLISYGEWPDKEIDHRDRDTLNTRLRNLRKSTPQQNCMNQGKRAHNTTGFKGVTAHANNTFWARISADGKRYHLGLYPEAWMAGAAYRIAAAAMHGEFKGV
jgi:hypothetical protein